MRARVSKADKAVLAIAFALSGAALLGAALLPTPVRAQEACLMGGPDPSADLACGPLYVAPSYSTSSSAAAQSRITSGGRYGPQRATGAARSRIISSGGSLPPAAPAPRSGYAPFSEPGIEIYPLAGSEGGAVPPAYIAPPEGGAELRAYGYSGPQGDYVYPPDGSYGPPPPPAYIGETRVEGGGTGPAPNTYAYSYESEAGAAFAYRYETPDGPAYAYAYETPQGRAFAWAYEAPTAAPVYAVPEHGHGHYPPEVGPPPFHLDWRYADELRLYGRDYPRMLYIVETWYRDTGWRVVDVSRLGGTYISCGACGGSGGYAYGPGPTGGPRGVFYGAGGGGGSAGLGFNAGYVAGSAGGADAVRSSASFSASDSFEVTRSMEAYAQAGPNQTVVAGTPFAPPAGAPVPPWGPPPSGAAGGANSAAYAAQAAYVGR